MKTFTHNTGAFIGKEGYEIFFQSWSVASPKAIIVIAHGVGEHSGRYSALAEYLKDKNISVYALDHRGHGRSGGKRGHVDSFMDYIYDLKQFVEYVLEEGKHIPVILLGHSMGGVIALKYGLTYPEDLTSMIISSPGLIPAFEVPSWKIAMAKFLTKYIPGLPMSTGLKSAELSHDKTVVEDYDNDPLVHGSVTPRWYTEFTGTSDECLARASEFKMPMLFFHGSEDKICDYKGTVQVYEKSSSKTKEIHIFENLYHETMNELKDDRKKVIAVVAGWIDKIAGKKISSPVKKTSAPKVEKKATKKPAAVKKAKGSAKPKAVAKVKKTAKPKAAPKSKVKQTIKPNVKKSSAPKKKK